MGRASLINYQRSRRSFIQSQDSVHLGLRGLLRQIQQLRKSLEIQRGAVAIAIRRVDSTRANLYAPPPLTVPGQRAVFGPTAARDALNAFTALRNSQNAFVSVWLNYYAARMRLARELGIMQLDPEGRWIEVPLPGSDQPEQDFEEIEPLEELLPPPLPPAIPAEWVEMANYLEQLDGPSSAETEVPKAQDQPQSINATQ